MSVRLRLSSPHALAAAGVAAGASGLMVMLITAAVLGPDLFGELGVILAFAAVGDVWRSHFQLRAAHMVAQGFTPAATAVLSRRSLGVVALLATAAVVPVRYLAASDSFIPAALAGMYVVLAAHAAGRRGMYLGLGQSARPAAALTAAALTRVAGALVLTPLLGVSGALTASIAAELVGLLVCPKMRSHDRRFAAPSGRPLGTGGLVAVGLLLLATPGADSLLARALLSPTGASVYTSASGITRGILVVAQLLVASSIGVFVTSWHTKDRTGATSARRRVVSAVTVLALGAAAAAPVILGWLAGAEFKSFAVTAALAASVPAVAWTFATTFWALANEQIDRRLVVGPLVTAPALVLVFAAMVRETTPLTLALVAALAAWIQSVVQHLTYKRAWRHAQHATPSQVRQFIGRGAQRAALLPALLVVAVGVTKALGSSGTADILALAAVLTAVVLALIGLSTASSLSGGTPATLEHHFDAPDDTTEGSVSDRDTTNDAAPLAVRPGPRREWPRPSLLITLLTGAIAGVVTAVTWFDAGKFYLFFDITQFDRRSLNESIWPTWGYEWSGAGGPTWEASRVLELAFYRLGDAVGSVAFGQRMYWALFVAAAASGVAALVGRLTRWRVVALIAGLLAVWNGFFIVYNRNPANYLVVALSALALAFAFDAARSGRSRPVRLVLLTLPMCYLGVNPPLLALAAAFFALAPLVGAFGSPISPLRGIATSYRQALLAAPFAVGISLWWSAPWLLTAWSASNSDTVRAVTDPVQYAWALKYNTLSNVLSLTANFSWPDFRYFRSAIDAASPAVVWTAVLPAAVAFALPYVFPRSKTAWASSLALALGVLLAKGLRDPLIWFNETVYRYVPGAWMLRQPMSKLGPFLVLGICLAAALTISTLLDRAAARSSASRSSRLRAMAAPLVALLAIVLSGSSAFPLWTGAIVPHAADGWSGGRLAIPEQWYQAADVVNDGPAGKVLVVPLADMYMVPTTWGAYGWDNLARQLFTRPTLVRNTEAYISDPASYQAQLEHLERALYFGDIATANDLVQRLGISTVVVRHDIAYRSRMRSVSMFPSGPLAASANALSGSRTAFSSPLLDVIDLDPAPAAVAVEPGFSQSLDATAVAVVMDDPELPEIVELTDNPTTLDGTFLLAALATSRTPPARRVDRVGEMMWLSPAVTLDVVSDGLEEAQDDVESAGIEVTTGAEIGRGHVVVTDLQMFAPGDIIRPDPNETVASAYLSPYRPLSAPVGCANGAPEPSVSQDAQDSVLLAMGGCASLSVPETGDTVTRIRYRPLSDDTRVTACALFEDGDCHDLPPTQTDGGAEFSLAAIGSDRPAYLLVRVIAGQGAQLFAAATASLDVRATVTNPPLFVSPRPEAAIDGTIALASAASAVDTDQFGPCVGQSSLHDDPTRPVVRVGVCASAPTTADGTSPLRVELDVEGIGALRICLAQGRSEACRKIDASDGPTSVAVGPLKSPDPTAPTHLLAVAVGADTAATVRLRSVSVDTGVKVFAVPAAVSVVPLTGARLLSDGQIALDGLHLEPGDTISLVDAAHPGWSSSSTSLVSNRMKVDRWSQTFTARDSVRGDVTIDFALERLITIARVQALVTALVGCVLASWMVLRARRAKPGQ